MLSSTLLVVLLQLVSLATATKVAVLELGKGGVLRRITSSGASPVTSVAGISSFWNAVHDEIVIQDDEPAVSPSSSSSSITNSYHTILNSFYKKKKGPNRRRTTRRVTQYPGMTVVPDLFQRANGGLVLGLAIGTGVDVSLMPTLARILNHHEMMESKVVGQFQVQGSQMVPLMKKAGFDHEGVVSMTTLTATPVSSIQDKIKNKIVSLTSSSSSSSSKSTQSNKLESIYVTVNNQEEAIQLDESIASILQSFETTATESDSTFLLHLVLDENYNLVVKHEDVGHRRLKDDNNNNNQNNNNQNTYQQYVSKYGTNAWAYTDANGQVKTNVVTIFQIQYYNIMLWTALGLVVVLYIVVSMMIDMPFMPDTLLFGESAKMVAE